MKLYINAEALLTDVPSEERNGNNKEENESKLRDSTLKITIPNSWMSKKCRELAAFIIKTVNNHLKYNTLNLENVRLTCENIEINLESTIESTLHEYNTIVLHHVKQVSQESLLEHNLKRCVNYGCGKLYSEDSNNDDACHYHEKNVVFHDCVKYWACCPGKKAYDWDEFEKLPTCKVGRHSCERVKQLANKSSNHLHEQLHQQHNVNAKELVVTSDANTIKSSPRLMNDIVDNDEHVVDNLENANCYAMNTPILQETRVTNGPREFVVHDGDNVNSSANLPDGYARCANFGCGKVFCEKENYNEACHFHSAGPVFWDTYKYWKCCPDKKCYDFDDFTQITGCCVGPHQRVRVNNKLSEKIIESSNM